MSVQQSYKDKVPSIAKRQEESANIRMKYPDKIPIICERAASSKLPPNERSKFLAPSDLTAYQFSYIIRKRIKMPESDSLYFFVNGRYILKGDTLMSEVYDQRKDVDGFLYITYTDESTLGGL